MSKAVVISVRRTEPRALSVRSAIAAGAVAQAVVLLALWSSVGLGAFAVLAGATCGLVTDALLLRATRRPGNSLGPADLVTLLRASLVAGVLALCLDGTSATATLVGLSTTALLLDAVDGWIARRTNTASALGARFDMEVDAFLILVLSLRVAQHLAPWVLLIGLARYLFVAAWLPAPWLRRPVPPRYWSKTVAAIQGIVLTVACSGLLPVRLVEAALVVALLLLAESFGRDVVYLWRHDRAPAPASTPRRIARWGFTIVGGLLLWVALLMPDRLERFDAAAFLRIPIEGLVVTALAIALPATGRRIVAITAGACLGVLLLLRLLDIGFNETVDRPFNPVFDWGSLRPAVGVVRDAIGSGWTRVVVALLVVVVVAVPVAAGAAMLRLTALAARHRRGTAQGVTVLAVAWCAAAAVGAPLASGTAARAVYAEGRAVDSAISDQQRFADALAGRDPMRDVPADRLLTGLRGKDVLLVFVESYGRVAVQDTAFSKGVDAVLAAGNRTLHDAGFASRSAFLTSPTFGGISWLAHSTMQSGLWIDNQQRYDQLVRSDRYTLSDAFRRAGWRTVADIPSNFHDWPQGRTFYHYAHVYDRRNVGYRGPRFGYAAVPDQYTLAAFGQRELQPGNRRPLFAEIDLDSSHTPWAPLPPMLDWAHVGDGSVYDGLPERGPSAADVWQSARRVQTFYGKSVEYSMSALTSYVANSADPNLVVVLLGDHQPAKIVSGSRSGHDVPISIVARDPAVLRRLDGWGWDEGLLPRPDAPVWPMDAFRNRFLDAFA